MPARLSICTSTPWRARAGLAEAIGEVLFESHLTALAKLASRVQYPYLVGMALAEQTAEPETICSAGLWVVVVVDARHGEPSQSSGRAHTLAASSLPPLQVRVRVRPPWWT